MIQKILDYWYALEFFNPCWPVKPKQDTNLRKGLPWLTPQNAPQILIILLFIFINDPILRAIICVVFIVIGGLGLSQD